MGDSILNSATQKLMIRLRIIRTAISAIHQDSLLNYTIQFICKLSLLTSTLSY